MLTTRAEISYRCRPREHPDFNGFAQCWFLSSLGEPGWSESLGRFSLVFPLIWNGSRRNRIIKIVVTGPAADNTKCSRPIRVLFFIFVGTANTDLRQMSCRSVGIAR